MLVACGDDDASALSPRCLPVGDDVVAAVQGRLHPPGGTLRHAFAVRSDDEPVYFLSAELVRAGRDERRGDILTWATADPRVVAEDYRAVDTQAAEHSAWPRAGERLRVTTDGAVLSRSCVNGKRPS